MMVYTVLDLRPVKIRDAATALVSLPSKDITSLPTWTK